MTCWEMKNMADVEKEDVYQLDLNKGETLSDQLIERLKKAIATGRYKPGDVLPSVRAMARLCGTSVRVPLAAVNALEQDGLVKARPRLGITVLPHACKLWKGRVLIVTTGGNANFHVNAMNAEIATVLQAANYRVGVAYATVKGDGMAAVDTLRKMLDEKYDLLILPDYNERILSEVIASGLPYILFSSAEIKRPQGCVGLSSGWWKEPVMRFANDCAKVGVRKVLQMKFADCDWIDVTSPLKDRSISVETIEVTLPMTEDRLERIERTAFAALTKWLERHARRLPDLIFFADDFIARGGLSALLARGVRVPEDVRVVSTTNRFFLPVFPKKLTRIECDTAENAKIVSRQAIDFLKTHETQKSRIQVFRYLRGQTF